MVSAVGAPDGTMTHTVAGGGESFLQLVERVDVAGRGVRVVADDGVAATTEPLRHVAAHFAQTDETDLHGVLPFARSGCSAAGLTLGQPDKRTGIRR